MLPNREKSEQFGNGTKEFPLSIALCVGLLHDTLSPTASPGETALKSEDRHADVIVPRLEDCSSFVRFQVLGIISQPDGMINVDAV